MMRRLMAVAVFAATLFSSTVVIEPVAEAQVVAEVHAVRSPRPCGGIAWRKGPEQRERLIRCAARRWDVPGGAERALNIARCESGDALDPRAFNDGSAGVFQHQQAYWRARAAKYLSNPAWGVDVARVPVWDAWANVVVAFRMAMDRDIGWGPWSCA